MNRTRGILTRWIEDKGFGFIRPDDGGKDVFVHIRDFGEISRQPKVGDVIRYQPAHDGAGKYRAADVAIEGVSRLPSGRPVRKVALRSTGTSPARHCGVVFVVIFGCVVGGLTVLEKIPIIIPFIYFIVSCCTFIVYAFDKSAAMGNRWRTKEKTLHLLGVMGGWPGALIAQRMFHHKSKKTEFLATFWLSAAVNTGFLIWLTTERGRSVIYALLG